MLLPVQQQPNRTILTDLHLNPCIVKGERWLQISDNRYRNKDARSRQQSD